MPTSTTPRLEDGWQPDTPVDDTMLRRAVLTAAASWQAIGEAAGARAHRDERFTAVDVGRPTGLFNSTVLLQPLLGHDLERALDDIEDVYDGGGSGSALLWSAWPTPDLTRRGWELQGHPPLLVRPAGLDVEEIAPSDLTLFEVTTSDELEEWRTVAVEGFPFDDVRPPRSLLDDAILDDARFRFVVGRVDDRPVAIGCQFVGHATNLLLLAATRPEARGRGYYSALAAHRIAREPDLPDVAIVSDASRPVLVDRFDFLPITRFTLWERGRR